MQITNKINKIYLEKLLENCKTTKQVKNTLDKNNIKYVDNEKMLKYNPNSDRYKLDIYIYKDVENCKYIRIYIDNYRYLCVQTWGDK